MRLSIQVKKRLGGPSRSTIFVDVNLFKARGFLPSSVELEKAACPHKYRKDQKKPPENTLAVFIINVQTQTASDLSNLATRRVFRPKSHVLKRHV